jgi:hypothetical protein
MSDKIKEEKAKLQQELELLKEKHNKEINEFTKLIEEKEVYLKREEAREEAEKEKLIDLESIFIVKKKSGYTFNVTLLAACKDRIDANKYLHDNCRVHIKHCNDRHCNTACYDCQNDHEIIRVKKYVDWRN